MKYGVGSWKDISMSGLLPGKAITQLNAQTQRLLGQQQLSGLSGESFVTSSYLSSSASPCFCCCLGNHVWSSLSTNLLPSFPLRPSPPLPKGLKVDVDRIRTDNESKEGVTRKGGLIVNFDKNPTAEFKKKLREENL